ncbi:MAG TPA: aldo/keto reductase [Cellulomonas sp.]
MTATALPTLAAHDGLTLPAVGFGTYQLRGSAGVATIVRALHTGYRVLDSAVGYENEGAVGQAVAQSGVPRDEIVVTSKLPGRFQAAPDAAATVEESLYRLGLDHLDLYLIHWPNPRIDRYVEAWGALIEVQRRGLVRHIGVCNFLPEHLDRLERETGVLPAVNQIELHPYFPQAVQRADDARRGIITQAWSPLGRANSLLQEPAIAGIADRIGVSPAQVVLRWEVDLGVMPLPKATGAERQQQNLDLMGFALGDEDRAALDALARPDGRTFDQDPARYEEL